MDKSVASHGGLPESGKLIGVTIRPPKELPIANQWNHFSTGLVLGMPGPKGQGF